MVSSNNLLSPEPGEATSLTRELPSGQLAPPATPPCPCPRPPLSLCAIGDRLLSAHGILLPAFVLPTACDVGVELGLRGCGAGGMPVPPLLLVCFFTAIRWLRFSLSSGLLLRTRSTALGLVWGRQGEEKRGRRVEEIQEGEIAQTREGGRGEGQGRAASKQHTQACVIVSDV